MTRHWRTLFQTTMWLDFGVNHTLPTALSVLDMTGVEAGELQIHTQKTPGEREATLRRHAQAPPHPWRDNLLRIHSICLHFLQPLPASGAGTCAVARSTSTRRAPHSAYWPGSNVLKFLIFDQGAPQYFSLSLHKLRSWSWLQYDP